MQDYFSTLHAMARAYAEAGIPVFPCVENGKQPATANGFHDATTDLLTIDAWWKDNPNYNLAICPADAGLFVVDIDPGADDDALLCFTPTYSVCTPRGGYHYYYEGTGPSSAGRLSDHIDTRSIGGYVLVPPSVVAGGAYTLEKDIDYAPLPAWILEKLVMADTPVAAAVQELDLPANVERARKILNTYVEREDVAVEGQGGDDRTYRLCCELLDLGLSIPVAKDLLEEIWNPHCQPPWDSPDLDIKFENASHYQQNETGAYGVGSPQSAFGEAVRKLAPSEKRSRFYFKDESEMDEDPDPEWLVKDLISERSTVMMYGASGSYKSFMALEICLSIATGCPTFGAPTKQGMVFYGALEGRAHLKKARRAWRVLHDVQGKIDNFYLGIAPMIGVEGEMQEFGDEIAKRCAGRRPALIVIDTLSKSMAGLNENDAQDAGKFIRFCDSLVEAFGCTVMAIHHVGKEENRGARGSSAFLAGFDTVLEVKAFKDSKALAVRVKKHKDAEEREQPWTFEGRITGPSLTFEATTPEQHRLLLGENNILSPTKVGAALKKLKAFGLDAAVLTTVLATELTPLKEEETIEERAAAVARTGRALSTLAKGILEAYCAKHGKGWVWYLPVPD